MTPEEKQKLFSLIKRVFPKCKAGSLYEACKNGSEYYLQEIIEVVQREAVEKTKTALMLEGHDRRGCCKSLEKALNELTPEKVLGEG